MGKSGMNWNGADGAGKALTIGASLTADDALWFKLRCVTIQPCVQPVVLNSNLKHSINLYHTPVVFDPSDALYICYGLFIVLLESSSCLPMASSGLNI